MTIPMDTAPEYQDFDAFYSERPARRPLDTRGSMETRTPGRYTGSGCGGCMGASHATGGGSPARFARPGNTGYPGPSRPPRSSARYPRGPHAPPGYKSQAATFTLDGGTILGVALIGGLTLWALTATPAR